MFLDKVHTSTSQAGIFSMDTVVDIHSIVRAVNQTSLGSHTSKVIQQDGSSTHTKECIAKCSSTFEKGRSGVITYAQSCMQRSLTHSGVAQLEASYSSISGVPEVITDSAPGLVIADFHTSFPRIGTTLESQVTIHAHNCK